MARISTVNMAKFFKGIPTQVDALEYLDTLLPGLLTDEQWDTLEGKWRAPYEKPKPSEEYIYACWSGKYDEFSNKVFGMYLMSGDQVIDKIACTSGQSYAQDVVWPLDDYSGSMRPLPEGIYDIGPLDDLGYDPGSSDGFGQWVYPLTPRAAIKRSALLVHCDRNRITSAGSAGCLCPYSIETMLKFVTWQNREGKPRKLVMDHRLGFLKETERFTAPDIAKKPSPSAEAHQPVGGNEVPQVGIDLIKEFEGCRLKAYNDGVGVMTIGWGTIKYPNGSAVKDGDEITQQEADDFFRIQLKGYWDNLKPTPFWDEMSTNQKAALLSFSYNTGWNYGNKGFSTMNLVIKEKRWDDVPAAFDLYVNPGTSTEAGLRRRRKAESKLWGS